MYYLTQKPQETITKVILLTIISEISIPKLALVFIEHLPFNLLLNGNCDLDCLMSLARLFHELTLKQTFTSLEVFLKVTGLHMTRDHEVALSFKTFRDSSSKEKNKE